MCTSNKIVALAILVSFAGTAGTSANAQASSPPPQPSFSISISTTQPNVRVGTPISVLITLTNTSGQDIYLNVSKGPAQGEFHHEVVVHDEKGKVPPLTKLHHVLRGEDPRLAGSQTGGANLPKVDSASQAAAAARLPPPTAEELSQLVVPYSDILVYVSPGEALRDQIFINKLYDLSRPGKYSVQVLRTDPESKTTVKSNIIEINVLPPTS